MNVFPVAFVPCLAEEDYGRASKSNRGQAHLVAHIVGLLRQPRQPAAPEDFPPATAAATLLQASSIAVLTLYARQVKPLVLTLRAAGHHDDGVVVAVSTVDGFQGREADVVVLSTVRSNADDRAKPPSPSAAPDGEVNVFLVAFVPCLAEEDYGPASKSNRGQAHLVTNIVGLLRQPAETYLVPEDSAAAALLQASSIELGSWRLERDHR